MSIKNPFYLLETINEEKKGKMALILKGSNLSICNLTFNENGFWAKETGYAVITSNQTCT